MQEYRITTEILWQASIIFALIDAFYVSILVLLLKPQVFRQIKTSLAITTGIFWAVVWILMSIFFWDSVYHYICPFWARWIIPPVYGLMFALIARMFWWLSQRLKINPIIGFCILGGLLGTLTHLWGISRGLIDKPPMLQGASPIAVLVLPFFEFIFYWSFILTIASLIYKLWKWKK